MKGTAYKQTLKTLGMSQLTSSKFLGFSHRQSRRIAAGTAELGLAAEKLLLAMMAYGLTSEMVNGLLGKPVPKKSKKTKAPAA